MASLHDLLISTNLYGAGFFTREIARQARIFFRSPRVDPKVPSTPSALEEEIKKQLDEFKGFKELTDRLKEQRGDLLREIGARHSLEDRFDAFSLSAASDLAALKANQERILSFIDATGGDIPRLPPPSSRQKSRPDQR